MNCFFHPEEVSVASCVDCGKGLCKTCVAKYEIAICDSCNAKRNSTDVTTAVKRAIPSIILFIIGFIAFFALMSMDGELSLPARIGFGFLGGWLLGGTIWGWFLSRQWFRPSISISDGGFHSFMWAAKMVARITVSVLVGIFVMPVGIIKLILALVKAKKVSNTINQ